MSPQNICTCLYRYLKQYLPGFGEDPSYNSHKCGFSERKKPKFLSGSIIGGEIEKVAITTEKGTAFATDIYRQ